VKKEEAKELLQAWTIRMSFYSPFEKSFSIQVVESFLDWLGKYKPEKDLISVSEEDIREFEN